MRRITLTISLAAGLISLTNYGWPQESWDSNPTALAQDMSPHIQFLQALNIRNLASPDPLGECRTKWTPAIRFMNRFNVKIVNPQIGHGEIVAGLVLMKAFKEPAKLQGLKSYLMQAKTVDNPDLGRDVIKVIDAWASHFQDDETGSGSQYILRTLKKLRPGLRNRFGTDLKSLERRINALFDGQSIITSGQQAPPEQLFGDESAAKKAISLNPLQVAFEQQDKNDQNAPHLKAGERKSIEKLLDDVFMGSRKHRPKRMYIRPIQTYLDTNALSLQANLDLNALSLGHINASPYGSEQLASPLLDAAEIRARQEAVRSIMTEKASNSDQPLLMASSGWNRPALWVSWPRHGPGHRYKGLWDTYLNIESLRETFLKGFLSSSSENSHKIYWATQLEDRQEFLKNIIQLMESMAYLDMGLAAAQAPRLRAMRWIAQAATQPAHPYGLYEIYKNIDSEDTVKQDQAISLALGEKVQPLKRLISLVEEFDLYRQIAMHADRKQWRTFPAILSPKQTGKPLLSIARGHTARVFEAKRKASIPNTVRLGGEDGKTFMIVTGPNRQGKSTLLRMVAQLVILAQLGFPVPADAMELTPLDLRVHMNLSDEPRKGISLFQAESESLRKTVLQRTRRHPYTLVLMDEMLPGTIDVIRRAIERVVIKKSADTGALFMVATHNMSTPELEKEHPKVINRHVDRFHLLPGAVDDMDDMVRGAVAVLRRTRWNNDMIQAILDELSKIAKETNSL